MRELKERALARTNPPEHRSGTLLI
ncbi:MAG: hypothetical protein JWM45_2650, partial [Pseudonocardiales bacterium]|nr:hypothetical protein [Pseudonocardiales bacterium]